MSRSDVDALNATFVQGLQKGDAAMVASVYGPGARLMPPGMDTLTGPAIEQFWQGAVDSGLTDGSLDTVSFEEHGDVAVEEGTYTMQVGGEVVDHGKYVVVHRRQDDGSWRFDVDIWNSSRPVADPTAQQAG
ncbi:YybH family protein [Modestobacter sp. URMC 112]